MTVISDTQTLAETCARMAKAPYVCVDTEFIRDRTYWPRVCLIQLATTPDDAVAVDPLAEGIDLAPLVALLNDPVPVKVFHSARQDLEIFYQLTGRVPAPLFDTQVAAMVCGFGESVGFDKLVSRFARVRVDKASQFTDWARRPLSERQLRYALNDVIHLIPVYEALKEQLEKSGRKPWLDEEMAVLETPATYDTDPANAWQRLKLRSRDSSYLGVLKEVARWREEQAQQRDLPRSHLLRDEAIQELAAELPADVAALSRLRAVPKGLATGRHGDALLAAVARGRNLPADDLPTPPAQPKLPRGIAPLVDLLKVLLKLRCEEADVASRLVASAADLELLAGDDNADVPALHGWRRELFGEEALALKAGRIALSADGRTITVVPLDPSMLPAAPPRRRSRRSGGRNRKRGQASRADAAPLPPAESSPDPAD
jgi:ribonuclease D